MATVWISGCTTSLKWASDMRMNADASAAERSPPFGRSGGRTFRVRERVSPPMTEAYSVMTPTGIATSQERDTPQTMTDAGGNVHGPEDRTDRPRPSFSGCYLGCCGSSRAVRRRGLVAEARAIARAELLEAPPSSERGPQGR